VEQSGRVDLRTLSTKRGLAKKKTTPPWDAWENSHFMAVKGQKCDFMVVQGKKTAIS